MKAVLKAQINKTDRNDARGLAQTMPAATHGRVHTRRPPSPAAFLPISIRRSFCTKS